MVEEWRARTRLAGVVIRHEADAFTHHDLAIESRLYPEEGNPVRNDRRCALEPWIDFDGHNSEIVTQVAEPG